MAQPVPREEIARDYSYLGDDYPRTWDVKQDYVHKATEDTLHYPSDTALGLAEWNTTLPIGGGIIYLGPHKRPFSISMFHQLRCLDILGREIYARNDEPASELAQHCMNYLRQMILCRSNTHLESAFTPAGRRIVSSSVTHTCRDWSAVYAAAEANFNSHVPFETM